jgi:hypothetical protein
VPGHHVGNPPFDSVDQPDRRPKAVRFLDGPIKNSFRVPFLAGSFPDAKFIFLTRNPRDNISSLIDGWHEGPGCRQRRLESRMRSKPDRRIRVALRDRVHWMAPSLLRRSDCDVDYPSGM